MNWIFSLKASSPYFIFSSSAADRFLVGDPVFEISLVFNDSLTDGPSSASSPASGGNFVGMLRTGNLVCVC
jgi:hypothetical protein